MLKPIEPEKPKAETPVAKETPVAAQQATPSPDKLSRTTDDKWVRPSEVSKDRMRHAEKHTGKTEMEKAMEAFKKAETVGIDEETGEGIVETRMLRASEVRELLESAESFAEQPELQPDMTGPGAEGAGIPPAAMPTAPSPKAIEESLLGAKSGYVESPPEEPVVAPEPTPPPMETGPGFAPQQPARPPAEATPQPAAAPPGAPSTPAAPSGVPAAPIPTVVDTTPPVPAAPSQEQVEELAQAATEKVEALLAKIPRPEYLEDQTIQKIISDFRGFHVDLRKFEVELASVSIQWDEKIRQAKNAEETKRLQYEGLTEQAKMAKDEWDRSVKTRKDAESGKKDEINSREKRLKETNKTIGQVEKALERRVRDLEKERKEKSE
jgi:hypothetical protein